MKKMPKIKKEWDRTGEKDEFYDEQSEKKYRSLKKIKRDKPPHKKWSDEQ